MADVGALVDDTSMERHVAVSGVHARISVFGRLAIHVDGTALSLGGPRQQAVLALLVAAKGSAVSAGRLIDDLWGDQPPAAARQTLQSYISNLRKLCNGVLHIEGGAVGYSIHSAESADRTAAAEVTLDAVEFEATIYEARRARAADPSRAATAYRRALAIAGTDTAYAGLDDVAALAAEADRLESIRLDALEERVDADLHCPPGTDVPTEAELAAELEVLVGRHPLRERLWGHLVVALYRGGRQAEALRALQRARRVLADELGVEPSAELRALEGLVLAQDPTLNAPAAPTIDAAVQPWGNRCPYKGLDSYGRDDYELFKGREPLVARLVAEVRSGGLASVVGPSGSGKSSLVHAGLLAQLAVTAGPDRRPPAMVVLTPGPDPLAALAEAVAPLVGDDNDGVREQLRTQPRVLSAIAGRLAAPHQRGPALVVVVDQLEDLFLLAEDPSPHAVPDRLRFVDQLVDVGPHPGDLAVLLVLRADLYERCPEIPALAVALSQRQILVGPMTADDLRLVVREPAALLGYVVEEALVDEIVADAADEPGALPLVSHTLTQTWERREGRTLRLGAYRAAGGLSGALARSADAVLAQLDAGDRAIAQRLFLTLVSARRDGRDQLRRIGAAELLGSDPEAAGAVLERLVRGRLVVRQGDEYQIAHHTLLSAWPTLRRWVDEDRDDLVQLDRLHDAAAEWERLDRDPGALHRGGLLAGASALAARRDTLCAPVTPSVQAFIDAGRQREGAAGRRRRNRSVLLASLTVVALVTAALAGVNTARAGRAERDAWVESQIATSRRLAAQSATALLRNDRDLAVLLALEAARTSPTEEAMSSLGEGLYSEQRPSLVAVGHEGEARVVVVNPNGRSLVSTGPDRTLRVWDLHDATQIGIAEGLEAEQRDLAFRPDGARFVSVGVDGAVRVWESATLQPIAFRLVEPPTATPTASVSSTPTTAPATTVPAVTPGGDGAGAGSGGSGSAGGGGGGSGSGRGGAASTSATSATGATSVPATTSPSAPTPETRRAATLRSVAWSPDGARLAVGTGDGWIVLVDAVSLLTVASWATGDSDVRDVAWSPDGRQLASGGREGMVRRWTADGRFSGTYEGHTDSVFALAWSPDGDRLASAGRDRSLRIWNVASGEALTIPDAHGNEIFALAWSGGGSLATGGADRVARQWNPDSGAVIAEFRGHTSDIRSVEFGPGDALVTSSSDATLRLWSPVSGRSASLLEGPTNALLDVSWARSAPVVAAVERDGAIYVWNGDDGRLLTTLPRQLATRTSVAVRPDGKQIAAAAANAAEGVALWNVATGERDAAIAPAAGTTMRAVAYLADGQGGAGLVVGDDGGTLREYASDGTGGGVHPGTGSPIVALAADPAGAGVAATTAAGDVLRWPAGNGRIAGDVGVILAAADGGGAQRALAWSPDGAQLAVGGADRTVRIIDVATGTIERELVHGSEVRAVAFDSTGRSLISGGRDRSLQFWDLATGTRNATIRSLTGDVRAIESSPTMRWFVVASNRGEVRRWAWPSRWLSDGCNTLSRNLSPREWTDYVGEEPYRTTCASVAAAPKAKRIGAR